ncbi:MAG: type II toxin-antitoxin system HipA family toxin [Solirubrobacterales bacterium]
MTLIDVNLWGRRIGAARQDSPDSPAVFEYDPDFLASPVEPSPVVLKKRPGTYSFPALPSSTFRGLPGLLWDSLPDRFGTSLIRRYFRSHGREPNSLNALELLSYVGARGMGALEFAPSVDRPDASDPLDVARLREFAAIASDEESSWGVELEDPGAMAELLEVGTSAGGARPKAVIGWNPATNEVRSGRIDLAAGFEYWLLKFDGVGASDRELGRSQGYGAIEFAYSRLAARAGITMTECRLFEEGERRHFMTKRFDRLGDGRRLHMHTLAGIAHLDFNVPGSASYEDAFDVLRELRAPAADFEQQFRRAVFNVVFRNQDDHPKNISFLMDREGQWRLSPAYDLAFAFNPTGQFTSRHQMSLAGKLDDFTRDDFARLGRHAGLVQGRAQTILDETLALTAEWPEAARDCGVPSAHAERIDAALRREF